MVDLLLENGARLDVTMQGENEVKFHYRKYLDFSECVDSFLQVLQRETTYVTSCLLSDDDTFPKWSLRVDLC